MVVVSTVLTPFAEEEDEVDVDVDPLPDIIMALVYDMVVLVWVIGTDEDEQAVTMVLGTT